MVRKPKVIFNKDQIEIKGKFILRAPVGYEFTRHTLEKAKHGNYVLTTFVKSFMTKKKEFEFHYIGFYDYLKPVIAITTYVQPV